MPAVAVAWPERNRRVPHEKSLVRTGEIKALSGLRIVAAVWVVLFHFRPWLEQVAPGFRSALAPVLNCGARRRPVLHAQRVRADLELPRPHGGVVLDSVNAALLVVAAGQGMARSEEHTSELQS